MRQLQTLPRAMITGKKPNSWPVIICEASNEVCQLRFMENTCFKNNLLCFLFGGAAGWHRARPGGWKTWAEVNKKWCCDQKISRDGHLQTKAKQKKDRERVIIAVLGDCTSANGILCPVLTAIVPKRCEWEILESSPKIPTSTYFQTKRKNK